MRSLLGGVSDVLKVRSERVDQPGPTNLVRRAANTVGMWLNGSSMSTAGVERYATDPTVHPIVASLAQDVAATCLRLYRPGSQDGGPEDKDDRTEVKEDQHPCAYLVAHPNPFQSRAELIEAGHQHVETVGESTILVERVGSMPVRLWVIPPWKLEPVKASIVKARPGSQFLLGWVYTADNGEQVPLKANEIIQVKTPNPADPYRGISPVAPSGLYSDSARQAAAWNRNFFTNGAVPEGVIEIEEGWSDDEYAEFVDRWRETHQGISNAHRVAILENGAKWVGNQIVHREMQFSELQTLSSEFVRQAWRYPKTMLGNSEDANRASAEAGEYAYGKWLVEPRVKRWVAALNDRLLPMFEGKNPTGLFWDFDPVVESDEQAEADTLYTRMQAAQIGIQMGCAAEEVLAACGLPPMTWTKPEVPGFDEEGKPYPKPGESPGSPARGDDPKRADGRKSAARP